MPITVVLSPVEKLRANNASCSRPPRPASYSDREAFLNTLVYSRQPSFRSCRFSEPQLPLPSNPVSSPSRFQNLSVGVCPPPAEAYSRRVWPSRKGDVDGRTRSLCLASRRGCRHHYPHRSGGDAAWHCRDPGFGVLPSLQGRPHGQSCCLYGVRSQRHLDHRSPRRVLRLPPPARRPGRSLLLR